MAAPSIARLPADVTSEDNFSSTERIRNVASKSGPMQPRQEQRSQGFTRSIQMLDSQRSDALNSVTRWFDAQAVILDQSQFEPDRYKREYANLQRLAMNKRTAIQANSVAQTRHIENMQKLVEDKIMEPEQMQATMLVMAGVPSEHVRKAFKQVKRQKPSTQLNEIDSQLKKIGAFVEQFEDNRDEEWWRRGRKGTVWFTPKIGGDKTGPKRRITKEETEILDALDDAKKRIAELRQVRRKLFKIMTPMEQYARQGTEAIERFGRGRTPDEAQPLSTTGLDNLGHWGVTSSTPTPERQPTPEELKKQRTEEAYEQGRQLGYWN